MKRIDHLNVYVDGASKGNPGDSSIGVFIEKDGISLADVSQYIGKATNNIAEYTALIKGLEEALKFNPVSIKVYSDSELMVKQLTGEYKIKSSALKLLYDKVSVLAEEFDNIEIEKIPREKNKKADMLANKAFKKTKGIFPKKTS
jgi:ribonuclease HI